MTHVARTLLHPREPGEPPWKYLLPVLAPTFAARAAIALSGDFLLHPDEIMQYLNPAHRLVFGNGVLVRGRRQTATSPERPASPPCGRRTAPISISADHGAIVGATRKPLWRLRKVGAHQLR